MFSTVQEKLLKNPIYWRLFFYTFFSILFVFCCSQEFNKLSLDTIGGIGGSIFFIMVGEIAIIEISSSYSEYLYKIFYHLLFSS
jgi:hypothetical protein